MILNKILNYKLSIKIFCIQKIYIAIKKIIFFAKMTWNSKKNGIYFTKILKNKITKRLQMLHKKVIFSWQVEKNVIFFVCAKKLKIKLKKMEG